MVYFVGKSDKLQSYTNYLEAKSGALADILSQLAFYRGAQVQNMFADYANGNETTQEDVTKTAAAFDSAGLYQQAEWLENDGTLYVLCAWFLRGGNAGHRPDLPAFFNGTSLKNDRIYFTANAVSPHDDPGKLARQAEENAKMQALLYLGGSVRYIDTDYRYTTESGTKTSEKTAFEAGLQVTSRINAQNISFRKEAHHTQKESDLRYHYYGLYSIGANAGTAGTVADYECFSYIAQAVDDGNNVENKKTIHFNGSRFNYDSPGRIPSTVDAGVPEFINNGYKNASEEYLVGVGTARTISREIQNLMAQNRAMVDLARQTSTVIQSTERITSADSKLTISGALKIRDELDGGGLGWHLWELSKEDAARASGGKP
jgi:hypothetical protein